MGPFRKDDMFAKISPHTLKHKLIPISQTPTHREQYGVPPPPTFTASFSFACKIQTAVTSYEAHHQTILAYYSPTSTWPALTFSKSTKYQGTSTFSGCCPSPIRWLVHLAPNKVQSLSFPFLQWSEKSYLLIL